MSEGLLLSQSELRSCPGCWSQCRCRLDHVLGGDVLSNSYHSYHERFFFFLLLSYLVALCEMPLGFTPSVWPVFSMGEPLNNRYYTAFTNPTHLSRLQSRCRLSFGKTGFPKGCFSALVTSLMQSRPGPQAWPNLPSPVGASSAWACFPETTSETGQSWRHILPTPSQGPGVLFSFLCPSSHWLVKTGGSSQVMNSGVTGSARCSLSLVTHQKLSFLSFLSFLFLVGLQAPCTQSFLVFSLQFNKYLWYQQINLASRRGRCIVRETEEKWFGILPGIYPSVLLRKSAVTTILYLFKIGLL